MIAAASGAVRRARRARRGSAAVLAVAVLAALVPLSAIWSLGVGSVDVSAARVASIVGEMVGLGEATAATPVELAVVRDIRLPRIGLAILVGFALSVSGAGLQAVFRNPLADPGIIGVAPGASLGAVVAIVAASSLPAGTPPLLVEQLVPLGAFAMAGIAALSVFVISRGRGGATMLVAGVAVSAFAFALVGLVQSLATDAELREITFWMMGSLSGATWSKVGVAALLVALAGLGIHRERVALDVLLLGDADARSLGIDVPRTRTRLVLWAALATGAVVALAGAIGFVGLVVPHLWRLAFGPAHRTLIPGAGLLGAALMIHTDVLARTVLEPRELPIGVVTAIVGAPVLMALVIRDRSGVVGT